MLEQYLKPHLLHFLKKRSSLTFYDYYKLLINEGSESSQTLCAEIAADLKRTYKDINEKKVMDELSSKRCHLVANHGGVENHPQLISSSILTKIVADTLGQDNYIFACTTISARNQTMPSGFYLNDQMGQLSAKRNFISFLSRIYEKKLICKLPAFDGDIVSKKCKEAIETLDLCPEAKEELSPLYSFKLPQGADFCAQTALYNSHTYDTFCKNICHNKTYFINEERVGRNLIVKALSDDNSPLFALFSEQHLMLELIESLADADNTWGYNLIYKGDDDNAFHLYLNAQQQNHKGTVLFYFCDAKGYHHNLFLRQSKDGLFLSRKDFSLRIDPSSIKEALLAGRIIPTFFLTYIAMVFCHGASLCGGVFFSHYIKAMLTQTAKVLSLPLPPCASGELIESFLLPFKVCGKKRPHPLSHLDLLRLEPLKPSQKEGLLSSKLDSSYALTIYEQLLRHDLTPAQIIEHQEELLALLEEKGCLEFV